MAAEETTSLIPMVGGLAIFVIGILRMVKSVLQLRKQDENGVKTFDTKGCLTLIFILSAVAAVVIAILEYQYHGHFFAMIKPS